MFACSSCSCTSNCPTLSFVHRTRSACTSSVPLVTTWNILSTTWSGVWNAVSKGCWSCCARQAALRLPPEEAAVLVGVRVVLLPPILAHDGGHIGGGRTSLPWSNCWMPTSMLFATRSLDGCRAPLATIPTAEKPRAFKHLLNLHDPAKNSNARGATPGTFSLSLLGLHLDD